MAKATAKSILLEILRLSDGEWTGKTRIFKAFYFAHLYYADQRAGGLTTWPIVRMPQGPGIDRSDELFKELVSEGLLTIERIHEGPYPEYRYRLTEKGNNQPAPNSSTIDAVRKAVSFCEGKTAATLSQLTHEKSRSWNSARDGEPLDIELDLIHDEEYAQRLEALRSNEHLLANIVGANNK